MASITWQGFTTFVNQQIAAVQASVGTPIYSATGSVTLALAQSVAGVALWLQAQAINILATTRAATSSGTDLDTWMADYGLTRLPAVSATGFVTFSRYTATQQALIPLGTQVSTGPAGINFQVTKDTTNPAWNSVVNSYVMGIGVSSLTVPISAVNGGALGNVLANTIQSFVSPIARVDTVTNAAATTAGADVETDAAFRTRFVNYLNNLSKATKSAIQSAILGVQAGITYSLTENIDYNGNPRLGYFYVVINDGTGTPPASLLLAVATAIDAVRPLCSVFGVYAPVTVAANVAMTITTGTGYTHSLVASQVATAIRTFISTLSVGSSISYTQLAAIAYGVAGVTNVTGVTLNGGTADLTSTPYQAIIAGTVTVV